MFIILALSFFAVCIFLQLPPHLRVEAQTSIERDFLAILNAERVALGKTPIVANSFLLAAAYLHSEDIAEQGYFSHTSLDGRTFDQRIIAAGYTDYVSLGENIAYAYGAPDAAKVYEMWKNSAGHYANMMGDFNEAGLGVYSKNGYTYYTLDLGKSRSPTQPTPTPSPTPTVGLTPTPTPIPESSTWVMLLTLITATAGIVIFKRLTFGFKRALFHEPKLAAFFHDAFSSRKKETAIEHYSQIQ